MKCFCDIIERWIGDREYAEVAPLLGAAFGTIHGWRHGTSLPPATRIPALAKALNVSERKLRQVIQQERAAKHAAKVAAQQVVATDAPAGVNP